ncbi:hypothetical protein BH20ACI2_BH20ACI2_15720 [soil metagenome]
MNTRTEQQTKRPPKQYRPNATPNTAKLLTNEDMREVLDFLGQRPAHTAVLSGPIVDHGIISPKHCGSYYGYRDDVRNLVGVALIGRHTILEARTDTAIYAFARCARRCPDVRMVFAEKRDLTTFWRYYGKSNTRPNVTCHRLIQAASHDTADTDIVSELRVATVDDLDAIVSVHAEMVRAETGVDPLRIDAEGFRTRCLQRVEKGRVWVWIRNGKLIFKTDIAAITPQSIYIEGLWVDPGERRKGIGTRGLASLCRNLLTRADSVCGFMDEALGSLHSFYKKAGFKPTTSYAKIYL